MFKLNLLSKICFCSISFISFVETIPVRTGGLKDLYKTSVQRWCTLESSSYMRILNDNGAIRMRSKIEAIIYNAKKVVSITEKQQRISKILKTVNSALSQAEKIRKFIIADEPFTVSNKMLTPTLKVRRHEVYKNYEKLIDELYK